jgi:hypothetical protein
LTSHCHLFGAALTHEKPQRREFNPISKKVHALLLNAHPQLGDVMLLPL